MMSRTLGAPLGGTTRGGHQGLESLALSLITPPNSGGGGGSCFPSIVIVALGEPNSPVTCCAAAGAAASVAASRSRNAATSATTPISLGSRFMHWAALARRRSSLMPRPDSASPSRHCGGRWPVLRNDERGAGQVYWCCSAFGFCSI